MQDVFLLVKGLPAVDIAKRYGVDLQQKGKQYRGLCPFHAEKTPSFHVHKNRFKCFGCAWSGDAVDLVSQLRNAELTHKKCLQPLILHNFVSKITRKVVSLQSL